MANLKVRYLVEKPGRDGPRFFWQPGAVLRRAGWEPQRLAKAEIAALATPATLASAPVRENFHIQARYLAAAKAGALNAEVDAWRRGEQPPHHGISPGGDPSGRIAPGNIAWLIRKYKASNSFSDLAPKTQRDYGYCLKNIETWGGTSPLDRIKTSMCEDFYLAMAETAPTKAKNTIAVLRLLFAYGARRDLVPWTKGANPARELRVKTPKTTARLWEATDVAAFAAAADGMGRHSIGTAVILNEWLGQRKGDILSMTWANYRGGAIWIDQSKTVDGFAILPVDIIPRLKARLEEERARQNKRAETVRVNTSTIISPEQFYQAYDEFNFTKSVREIINQAALLRPEIAGLQFRHLRHTAVTRLAEANVSVALIAAVTGHSEKSVETIIGRYKVRTRKQAVNAFTIRLDAERGEQEKNK